MIRRDRETGDNFDEGVHLALGARGLPGRGMEVGGRRRVQPGPAADLGTGEAPGTRAVGDVGHHRDGGPVGGRGSARRNSATKCCRGCSAGTSGCAWATPNPRAARTSPPARPGRCATATSWIINGSKMFTTGAHNCQYVFLITNTDPDAPKHKSLTMFLVPLDPPGIEIQGIRTVDGDRTNIVYYSDVRVDDKYRLGEVNDGWTVLRGPLNVEHGAVAAAPTGCRRVDHDAPGRIHGRTRWTPSPPRSAEPDPNGRRLIDDGSVAYRLGRSVARMEAAMSAPSIFGRVADRADDARHRPRT